MVQSIGPLGARCESHRAADAPADDAPGKDVDNEGDVDKTLPSGDVREIADPQLVWSLGLELAVDAVEQTSRVRSDI